MTRPIDDFANNVEQSLVTTQSINNVDITPVLKEVIEYSKDQASIGNIEEIISKVPMKESLDWKLVDGIDVIVHIFNPDKRKFYELEKIWSELIPKEKVMI